MNTVYLLLGSNLGNSKELFQQAIQMLELVLVLSVVHHLCMNPTMGLSA